MLTFVRNFSLLALFSLFSTLIWADKPLLVSTQPIFLIAQEVTKGIEQPELLLKDQSGHDIQLSPAHRKKIQEAGLIIWIGKEHEYPLQKAFQDNLKAVSILDSGIINKLPQRDSKGNPQKNTIDTHIWLEPNHAVRIAFFISALRGQQFPEHKAKYRANAQQFASKMFQLVQRHQNLGSAQPYWSYHDAYQYMERVLNLKFEGSLINDHHHGAVTASQLKFLNDNRPQKKMCLVAESSVSQKQYQHLQPVVFQQVDETFKNEKDFVEAWRKLAQNFQKCLHQAKA